MKKDERLQGVYPHFRGSCDIMVGPDGIFSLPNAKVCILVWHLMSSSVGTLLPRKTKLLTLSTGNCFRFMSLVSKVIILHILFILIKYPIYCTFFQLVCGDLQVSK